MRRRLLAVLLISGMLFLAVIPLEVTLSNSSAGAHSSVEHVPVMRVLGDVDKIVMKWGNLGKRRPLSVTLLWKLNGARFDAC